MPDSNAILSELKGKGLTVCVAESLTGGLVGAALSTPSGASAVFLGGVIAYCDEAKRLVLGVEVDALSRYSAVSEVVARQMAEGAKRLFHADYALATTGVAGPGSDPDGNPEGLVFVAIAGPNDVVVKRFEFKGSRQEVRAQAVVEAMNLLIVS